MAKKNLDDLARILEVGLRSIRDELQGLRVAIGQTQESVIGYSGKEQEHHRAHGERIDKVEADVNALKRKAAM
jgi:hypothetical protein